MGNLRSKYTDEEWDKLEKKEIMKERKFITHVSMRCTKEQYERDLKKPLGYLGYKDCNSEWYEASKFITNNWDGGNSSIGSSHEHLIKLLGGYLIDYYNPELFLSLAAMTEGSNLIKGEYVYCKTDKDIFPMRSIGNIHDESNYRKPTKEELINHFTEKEFVLPNYWCIRDCGLVSKYISEKYRIGDCVYEDYYLHLSTDKSWRSQTGNEFSYQGSILAGFTEITLEQFKKYVLKEDKDMKKESRFPFELDLEGARKIIDVACKDWKGKLRKKWSLLLDKPTILISKSFYKEMRAACNDEQHKVLDSVFGKDEKSVEDELSSILDSYIPSSGHHLVSIIKENILETFDIKFKE